MQIEINLKEPHPLQRDFIYSPARRKICRAGRRSGKTTGVSIYAVMKLLEGRRILYATPTQEQIGKFWWEVTTALKPAIEAGLYKKHEGEKYIVPLHADKSEARLKAKTAWNANTLRGDFADLLILDEYQLMDPEVWTLVGAPMLLDNDGDAIFIYTSEQRAVHASEMFKRAEQLQKEAREKGEEPRWAAFHFTSHDNPHISKVALEEITGDMSDLAYRLEIMAEDLDDDPRALWNREMINKTRVLHHPELTRIAVGIDPQGGMVGETGIVVGGVAEREDVSHGYLLEDASISGSPETWAAQAVAMYHKYDADVLVAERNFGGDMVEAVIKGADPRIPVKIVTASRGKMTRAQPISLLMDKERIHHVGEHPPLEDELCTYYQTKSKAQPSPNRYDAYVWAFTELMLEYCATELGTIQIPMV
jgi:hypothetical protein